MNSQGTLRALTAAIILSGLLIPFSSAYAAGTVGTGTPASCTEAAFDKALAGGGLVTFNCGPSPFILFLTSTKNINVNTTIDGATKITLDGGGAVQLFTVSASHSLTLKNLTLTDGAASSSGGAVADSGGSTLSVANCMFFNNVAMAVGGLGGAIVNVGTATINSSSFLNNSAGTNGQGGAIYNTGTLTISGGYFAGNKAPSGFGGAISNSSALTIGGSYFASNGAAYGGAMITGGGPLTLNNSTFYKNSATAYGGAVVGGNMTITASTFDHNTAPHAGAVDSSAGVSIRQSTFSYDTATSTVGGAIENIGTANTITDSTLYSNTASTDGGAIYNASIATVNLNNDTIAGSTSGSGLYNVGLASAKNTILAGNSPGNCVAAGTLTSLGHNLDSAHTCLFVAAGDLSGVNPILGALANNGGPTMTMRLNAGSPAIDHGSSTGCVSKDQRGVARPQGPACDIGAYEVRASTFRSVGTYDGWVLESGKATNVGGSLNSTAGTFFVGDDAGNRRYRGFLSFDTSALPDAASVVLAKLGVKKQSVTGNPFGTQGTLLADLRKPYFGAGLPLVNSDWQASATVSSAATFGSTLVSGFYSAPLNSSGRSNINKAGPTQFRLRFSTDNYNAAPDYLSLFSGDYATASSRPFLIVYYNP